jgi:hypothetical protein
MSIELLPSEGELDNGKGKKDNDFAGFPFTDILNGE